MYILYDDCISKYCTLPKSILTILKFIKMHLKKCIFKLIKLRFSTYLNNLFSKKNSLRCFRRTCISRQPSYSQHFLSFELAVTNSVLLVLLLLVVSYVIGYRSTVSFSLSLSLDTIIFRETYNYKWPVVRSD